MKKYGQSGQQDRAAFNEAYASLNAAQKQAVDTIEGPVMVIAGPGTGKTQILTLRIAAILERTDTNPENILALTFTNSGVRAMRERLRTYIKDDAYRISIYTFHSFAEHILQTYSSYFPSHASTRVITDVEKAKILEHILEQHEFSEIVSTYDRFSSLRQVMDAINTIKQEGLQPHEFEQLIPQWKEEQMAAESMFYKRATGAYKAGDIKPTEKQKVEKRIAKAYEIGTVFNAYQNVLAQERLYDFSDMILLVLHELEHNESLKLDLQEMYQYILVDEHQDTNEGQNKLIELLTDAEHLNGRPNLFTVGDEKQSIYRFQGASDATFKHFQSHYNDVQVIELEENYRSTKPILDASHELIQHSLPQAQKLKSHQSETKPISIREFSDYKFELLFVVEDIAKKIQAGTPANEIAILYRSNKHLLEIKSLLHQFSIPYQVLSRDTLLDDPAIQMLIQLFRVIVNPYDDNSLGKLLFADFLGLHAIEVSHTLRIYRSARREKDVQGLIDVLRLDKSYSAVTDMIADLIGYEANHTFSETFKEVLHRSGFLATLLSREDSRSGLRKVEVLFNEFRQQADRAADYRAKDFIAFIDATVAYNLNIEVTAARVGTGVQCMTAHGSKGLEFEHVYMINTARSNWEKSRGFQSMALPLKQYAGELDDERRLFYVAITRAKTQLSISSSAQDWSGRPMEPSQFISELAEGAVESIPTESFESEHETDLIRFFFHAHATDSVFEIEYLKARFLEENLSVTALNNYLDCPLKYLFRNLIQLPDVYTPALRYGDTMHRALEQFFTDSAHAQRILSKKELLSAYETAMQSSGFVGNEYETFLTKGRQSLGMYYDYYHANWSYDVQLEVYVRRSLAVADTEVTISGKIDKLEFLDTLGSGQVRVVDYKTGKTYSEKSTKAQKEALERQITFYYLLLENYKHGDMTVIDAVLDFVEPSKKQVFEQKRLSATEVDIHAVQREIHDMYEAVTSGEFLKQGCGTKECEWCAFWAGLQK